METCVRGFSFMPDTNADVVDLKYVESDALERTWKTTRRERIKQQEQKIWEEFVKEEDIVRNISQDDPYQFIDQLPEACIKELLDLELQKMKQEVIEEVEADDSEHADAPPETDNQHVLTIVEDTDKECDMLHIFDDDKDDDVSGPEEEEALNDSIGSPCTVRERQVEDEAQILPPNPETPDKVSNKSSTENVADMIECSIYTAKVKELRMRINEELINIIEFLERQDFRTLDPEDVPKLMKRYAEFSARFSRVHVYPLQRQLVELERLARAARASAQARAARACSLLHELLAAAQLFQKSVSQCVCSSADALRTLAQLATDAARISAQVFKDGPSHDIEVTCEKLNDVLADYMKNISEYISNIEKTRSSITNRPNKLKGKKKSIGGVRSKYGSKSYITEARLSMYSMDTRAGVNPKSSSSKDNSSGTSKVNINTARDTAVAEKEEATGKKQKKSPRNRPLMRAPATSRRAARASADERTLVEAEPCTSDQISREASPVSTPKSTKTPRKRKDTTRMNKHKSLNSTPRNVINSTNAKNSPKINDDDRSRRDATIDVICDKKETEGVEVNALERDANINVKVDNVCKEVFVADERKMEKELNKVPESDPASVDVTKLLRQLCGGDAAGSRKERATGAKNAQLLCVTGSSSPRQPSTPQLLRILEETIQKKTPKALFPKAVKSVKDAEKYRMPFNIPERVTDNLFQYRTKFVQHMLSSTMYANSAIGKPWEKIGSVSEQIIDELLLNCVKDMELHRYIEHLYKAETC